MDAEITGSVRRARETVRDLDLLVASNDPEATGSEFARLPQVNEVISQAPTTITIRVRSGMQVDLRAVKPESFGAAWQQFTGSPAHLAQLQARAELQGKRIDEAGVFAADGRRIAGATEEEVYGALGCAWIPPELREGWGEVELAANGALPALVQQRDLRGDLHTHSSWSDGRYEISVMARAATERGYAYLVMLRYRWTKGETLTYRMVLQTTSVVTGMPGISEMKIAQGLTPERFRQRASEIADVNGRRDGAQVLNGAEVDILPDGSLDLPDDCLASLDVVVASVHTALDQPKDVITQRVLSALRSPHVDVLAHPTSRRLDRRGETSLDIDAVIAEAVKTGTALEINSSPWRLDLNDSWARKAREAGAMLAIDTDAHYPAEFDSVRYGCAIARRAGLTPDRILNARDVDGLLTHCRAKAARAVANFR